MIETQNIWAIIPNKYGYYMNLDKLAKLLKKARIEAGKKQGRTRADGEVKPITQKSASEQIGCSLRLFVAVESEEQNFALKAHSMNAFAFIERYLGKGVIK